MKMKEMKVELNQYMEQNTQNKSPFSFSFRISWYSLKVIFFGTISENTTRINKNS